MGALIVISKHGSPKLPHDLLREAVSEVKSSAGTGAYRDT